MDIRCSSFAAGTTRVTRALPRAAATRTTFTSEPEGGGEGGMGGFRPLLRVVELTAVVCLKMRQQRKPLLQLSRKDII